MFGHMVKTRAKQFELYGQPAAEKKIKKAH